MTHVNVRLTPGEIDEAKDMLASVKNGFVRCWARALNKAATGTRTDMVDMARQDYNYKAAAVRARTWISRASWSKLTSRIDSKGAGIHLTDMLGTRQISMGLSVNIKKSTGRQRLKHGFIAPGRSSGKLLAYWRARPGDDLYSTGQRQLSEAIRQGHVGPSGLVWRKPITALYAPHPEVIWNTNENWETLRGQADDRLTAAFKHEIDYVMDQYS